MIYRWFVGHNDRDGKPLTEDVNAAIHAAFKMYFPGQRYFLRAAEGIWEGQSENTTIAELPILDDAEDSIARGESMAAHLAEVLRQQCVLFTKEGVNVQVIRPSKGDD